MKKFILGLTIVAASFGIVVITSCKKNDKASNEARIKEVQAESEKAIQNYNLALKNYNADETGTSLELVNAYLGTYNFTLKTLKKGKEAGEFISAKVENFMPEIETHIKLVNALPEGDKVKFGSVIYATRAEKVIGSTPKERAEEYERILDQALKEAKLSPDLELSDESIKAFNMNLKKAFSPDYE